MSLDRSVAVPVSVTGELISSMTADVEVDVDYFSLVTSGGEVDPQGQSTLSTSALWAGSYSGRRRWFAGFHHAQPDVSGVDPCRYQPDGRDDGWQEDDLRSRLQSRARL